MYILCILIAIPLASSCLRTVTRSNEFLPTPNTAITTGKNKDSESTVVKVDEQPQAIPSFDDHIKTFHDIKYNRAYHAKVFSPYTATDREALLPAFNTEERGEERKHEGSVEVTVENKPATTETSEMCGNCPSLLMSTTSHMHEMCENWKQISDNFFLEMDTKQPRMNDQTTVAECRRTITCREPKAIIRWLNFSMCDVHTAWENSDFHLNCNGTHWTMHGFPVDAVTCAHRHD